MLEEYIGKNQVLKILVQVFEIRYLDQTNALFLLEIDFDLVEIQRKGEED